MPRRMRRHCRPQRDCPQARCKRPSLACSASLRHRQARLEFPRQRQPPSTWLQPCARPLRRVSPHPLRQRFRCLHPMGSAQPQRPWPTSPRDFCACRTSPWAHPARLRDDHLRRAAATGWPTNRRRGWLCNPAAATRTMQPTQGAEQRARPCGAVMLRLRPWHPAHRPACARGCLAWALACWAVCWRWV